MDRFINRGSVARAGMLALLLSIVTPTGRSGAATVEHAKHFSALQGVPAESMSPEEMGGTGAKSLIVFDPSGRLTTFIYFPYFDVIKVNNTCITTTFGVIFGLAPC